jgi:2-polyprenyl-3-methyl-5-hydroxy-6-metoxy-1,4-benzoquinol methylase
VRGFEASERAFFAGYYAERRYHPTGWRLRLERDVRVLCAAAPGGRLGHVVSVGCGDGAFELMLASRADSVLGVDLSPEAIEAARHAQASAGVRNVEFRCMSVADLALTERFDTFVCLAFLHHLPPEALSDFFRAAYDCLEPDGLFYSQDPNVNGLLRLIGRRVMGSRYDTYHSADERELDPAEITAALSANGFEGISIRYIDLTLIPSLFVLTRGPDAIFRTCAAVDRLWCASPLARWASGFAVVARKPAAQRVIQ